jgi:putative addiction module component (TIGR02574 family)
MSKSEILAQLPHLNRDELAEVQAKLDELAGEVWLDDGELSDADKKALDAALAEYRKNPNAGSSWEQVRARIGARLRP